MFSKILRSGRWAAQRSRLVYFLLLPLIVLRRLFLRIQSQIFNAYYISIFKTVEDGSVVVRLPDFQGSFEMSILSHITRRVLRNGCYEPELVELLQHYLDVNKDVLDIGANIGLYTVLFSKQISNGNKVLAIEPTPGATRYLHHNVRRNGCQDAVIVFEGIATDREGEYELNIMPGREEYSSLGNLVHPAIEGTPYQQIKVKGDTVDNLVTSLKLSPGLMKIDTEGSELQVVKGAVNTLRKCRPIIISELSDKLLSTMGTSSHEVVKFLQDNGYEVRDVRFPQRPVRVCFEGNILALPIDLDRN